MTRAEEATALREVLEAEQIKYPLVRKGNAFPARTFMQDPDAVEVLFDYISAGHSLRQFVVDNGFPPAAQVSLARELAKLKPPDPRFEAYEIARQARASQFADRMLDVVTQVEMDVMTPQQGTFCVLALQWLAERMDPERFSGRIQIDARVKIDTQTQHLEAVRLMANMIKEGRPGTVYQGTYVEELPPPPLDPLSLLE